MVIIIFRNRWCVYRSKIWEHSFDYLVGIPFILLHLGFSVCNQKQICQERKKLKISGNFKKRKKCRDEEEEETLQRKSRAK